MALAPATPLMSVLGLGTKIRPQGLPRSQEASICLLEVSLEEGGLSGLWKVWELTREGPVPSRGFRIRHGVSTHHKTAKRRSSHHSACL